MRISRELYTFTIIVLLWSVFLIAIAGADDQINTTNQSLIIPVQTQAVDSPTLTIPPTITSELSLTEIPALSVRDAQDIVTASEADGSIIQHPLMHPSKAQLDEEEIQFMSVKAYTPPKRSMIFEQEGGTTSKSLLSYISYVPSERDQGGCGDCWVWASTGVLEIDHTVQTGINDRLSTQYFNSKYQNGQGSSYACCGGNLQIYSNWYNTDKTPIPWSNTNASFGDQSQSCSEGTAVPISLISTTPHYQLSSISYSTVSTYQNGNAAANIQAAIDNNKAVYYAFYYGISGWSNFNTFWSTKSESVIWDPDSYGGVDQTGGHATMIVGYDKTDPANPYWIVLNSWGTTSGRPNGIFRIKMNMNYNNTYTSGSSSYAQHKFYVINSVFNTPVQAAPTVTGIFPSYGFNSSSITVTNLAGTNFYGSPTVKLNKTGSSNILATNVNVIDSTNITCTFPITGIEAGQYNVTVVNPDGQEAMLVNKFNVMRNPSSKIGTFRNGLWGLDYNGNFGWDGLDKAFNLGQSGDIPVVGDWNRDGVKETGIFRNGVWALDFNGNRIWDAGDKAFNFGTTGDVPVVGDWNDDGNESVGIFRNGLWGLDYNGNFAWDAGDKAFNLGTTGDMPVVGDWNGDGKSSVGIFRNGLWGLDFNGNFAWDAGDKAFNLGTTGDVPAIGDWNGDGKSSVGIFRNGLWGLDYNGNFAWDSFDKAVSLGQSADSRVIGIWS